MSFNDPLLNAKFLKAAEDWNNIAVNLNKNQPCDDQFPIIYKNDMPLSHIVSNPRKRKTS